MSSHSLKNQRTDIRVTITFEKWGISDRSKHWVGAMPSESAPHSNFWVTLELCTYGAEASKIKPAQCWTQQALSESFYHHHIWLPKRSVSFAQIQMLWIFFRCQPSLYESITTTVDNFTQGFQSDWLSGKGKVDIQFCSHRAILYRHKEKQILGSVSEIAFQQF